MLEIDDLTVNYGPVKAVRGVNMHVGAGEFVTVVGANGAGKSTLLGAVAGLLGSRSGRIAFAGQTLPPGRPEIAVGRGLALVAEEREVFAPLTVEENLILGAFVHGGRGARVQADLSSVYGLFPILAERRRAAAGTLSGGQQQMLAIGRAIMARPKLLLLDEPSLGLAPLVIREIFATIQDLREQGLTVVLVEQNARLALSMADRGYVMEAGVVVLMGTGAELLADERVRRAYLGSHDPRLTRAKTHGE